MCEKAMAIMIGIQGSGKSTFCQEHLSSFCRINLDTLKTRHQEQLAIDECFKCGKNIVIDNTNPTVEERKKYILQAKNEGYKINGYFLEKTENTIYFSENLAIIHNNRIHSIVFRL